MPSSIETYLSPASYEEALQRACVSWGVQEDYWDIWGNHHVTPPDVQKAVLLSLGVPAESAGSLNRALEERSWQKWSRLVDSTLVVSLSKGNFPISLPAEAAGSDVTIEFEWEGGLRERRTLIGDDLPEVGRARIRDRGFVQKLFPLPASAELGYHRIRVEAGGAQAEARLILCPDRAFLPEFLANGGKAAGIAVSLYGLRSERNWGCGDFTDLEEFSSWAASTVGVDFVALNPLHSIPNRAPYNTSPYLPNCSFYRNPIYLDIERIEDIRNSAPAQAHLRGASVRTRLQQLRAAPFVEYEKVWAIKLKFLKLAFREFMKNRSTSERARDFQSYVEREGTLLHKFALYCALDESIHKLDRNVWIWPDWPKEFQSPESPQVADFARKHLRLILFYKYIQWQLDLQLAEAQRHARQAGLRIGLYHDLALATDRCGSDLWAHGHFYVNGCRVGSPPDGFAPKGQDWAFPPPNAVSHRQNGYELFGASIRKNSRHGGALRIDHVMRFFRLFWIPEGKEATEGVYVRDFADDLMQILALESVRNQVVVIGEDLGTVEPYIREALAKIGVLSYRLLFFERLKEGAFKMPDEYPEQALVSVSTHDLPTLAGFWLGKDIDARRDAGVLGDHSAYEVQRKDREADKQKMLDVMHELRLLPSSFPKLASEVPAFTGELHNAAVGFLARTPSMLMVLNQEDLFKEEEQQNLPGTTSQYPNWRHKMQCTIEDLRSNTRARDYAGMFRHWLEETGRLRR